MKLKDLAFALGVFLIILMGGALPACGPNHHNRGVDRRCFGFNRGRCPGRDSHTSQPRD